MSINNIHSRFNIVKGMNNAKYKQEVISFVKNLISNYSEYNSELGCYLLYIDKIDETDLWKFSSIIMSIDDDRAWESTGPDNPLYEKKLLPSLIKVLSNVNDKDYQIDFIRSWREGIGEYFKTLLEELIEEQLQEYNLDKGCKGEGYYESSSNFF